MSDSVNPTNEVEKNLELTDNALRYLKVTSLWAKVLSVFYFIACAFLFLGALMMIIASVFGFMDTLSFASLTGPIFLATVVIFYIVSGVVSLVIGMYLNKIANNSSKLIANVDTASLTNVFNSVGKYFKLLGIFTIVMIVFFIIYFAIGFFSALI